MNIRPLDDRVVVEPMEQESKTSGGIVLPDTAKEKPQRGRVLAVGPGRLLENGSRVEPAVKKGDEVLYGKYSGHEVSIEGKDHVILKESEILARIDR